MHVSVALTATARQPLSPHFTDEEYGARKVEECTHSYIINQRQDLEPVTSEVPGWTDDKFLLPLLYDRTPTKSLSSCAE